jgi:hypothetical protein
MSWTRCPNIRDTRTKECCSEKKIMCDGIEYTHWCSLVKRTAFPLPGGAIQRQHRAAMSASDLLAIAGSTWMIRAAVPAHGTE